MEIGDTLYAKDNDWVIVYHIDSVKFAGEYLRLLRWERYINIYSPHLDSGIFLQAYNMPFNLPYESSDCSMPGYRSSPIFVYKGDTLHYTDIE